jgi:hypothetical protein
MLQISSIGISERQVSLALFREPLVPLRIADRCFRGGAADFGTGVLGLGVSTERESSRATTVSTTAFLA